MSAPPKYIRYFLCCTEKDVVPGWREQWELGMSRDQPVLTCCPYNKHTRTGVANILGERGSVLAIHVPKQKTGAYAGMSGCVGLAVVDYERLNGAGEEWQPEEKHATVLAREQSKEDFNVLSYIPIKFLKQFDKPRRKQGNNSAGICTIQFVNNPEWIEFYDNL